MVIREGGEGVEQLFERLAALLDYPGPTIADHTAACGEELAQRFPQAAAGLLPWRTYLHEHPLSAVEELYTHTFDLNPVCTLEVSFYLFGEDYRRGMFLAQLRASQQEVGLRAGRELPDHLPVLLRWLARIYGSELHIDLVSECLLPALRRMDQQLAERSNPYRGILQTIAQVLEQDLAARGQRVQGQSKPEFPSADPFLAPLPDRGGTMYP